MYPLKETDESVKEIILSGALFVPSFPTSLFQVRAAVNKGANVTFELQMARLVTMDSTQFILQKQGQLYYLPTHNCSNDIQDNTARTLTGWHKTLRHMNHENVLQL